MQVSADHLEDIRLRERKRMELLLASQVPLTEADWLKQVKEHASAGRDTQSALPLWKRWLRIN